MISATLWLSVLAKHGQESRHGYIRDLTDALLFQRGVLVALGLHTEFDAAYRKSIKFSAPIER